jgi:biotin carboxyl carrier protein
MVHWRFVRRRGGERLEWTVEGTGGPVYRVTRGGHVESVEVRRLADGRLSLLFDDGRQISGRASPRGATLEVTSRRGRFRVALADPLADRMANDASSEDSADRHEEIRTPMPGRVIQVCVEAGERVEAGALLLVLEAMKMQNEIRAPLSGGVEQVRVADGQSVEAGAVLLSIRGGDAP